MRRNHHDPHTNVTSAPPAELATNVKMTSVCAGHQLREPPAGIEPATLSLPWNHQEPLCGPPFPQVTPDRKGQSYGFYFHTVMRSPVISRRSSKDRRAIASPR